MKIGTWFVRTSYDNRRYSNMVGDLNTVTFTLNGKVQVVNG